VDAAPQSQQEGGCSNSGVRRVRCRPAPPRVRRDQQVQAPNSTAAIRPRGRRWKVLGGYDTRSPARPGRAASTDGLAGRRGALDPPQDVPDRSPRGIPLAPRGARVSGTARGAPARDHRGRAPRCGCGRWRRAGRRRRRQAYVTCRRRRRSGRGVRSRPGRGGFIPNWTKFERISAPNAAFRVDRSPPLCSAGRFDIIELLRGDLHRLRRPQGARHSPKASRPRTSGWSPRPCAAASGPCPRALRSSRPSSVPTAAAGRWIAAESALGRPQGPKTAHFRLNSPLCALWLATTALLESHDGRRCRGDARRR